MNTEYVAALDALKETLNSSNNLTSFASEFIKQYSLCKEYNGKEQNKEFTETKYERNFLRETLLLLLERLGREAKEKGISLVNFQKQPLEVFFKKNLFLKISQYSQENTCVRVSFNKSPRPAALLKRVSSTGVFLPVL